MTMIRTMTPAAAAQYLRERGMSTSADTLRAGIQQGVFPFGDCVALPSGGATYTIYQRLLDRWIEERAG